jgi:uncharacterized membrane protein
MSVQDAFAAPRSAVRDVNGGAGVMTDTIINALKKTRPWVLFLAILGFVGAALTLLVGISVIISSVMLGKVEGIDAEIAPFGSGMMIGLGVVYAAMALIYFFSSLYLLRYAGAIKRLSSSLSVADLEAALTQQASFWKLIGILALISIVLMVVMLLAGLGGALFMGASAL